MRNKDDFEARVKAIFREPKKTRIKAAIFFIGIDNIRQLKNTFGQAAAKRILQIVENEISHYCNEFIETSEIPNISIKTFKSYESSMCNINDAFSFCVPLLCFRVSFFLMIIFSN